MTKICSKCKLEKYTSKFTSVTFRSGNTGYKAWCRKCCSVYDREYNKRNREQHNKQTKEWAKANRGKCNAWLVKYRAAKLQRTVSWANLDLIKEVYSDCVEINLAAKTAGCTDTFVVDHIIPLQGKLVSGLHVENNLQIITVSENCIKNNSFTPGRN